MMHICYFFSDWATRPENKELTLEQDISKEESSPGVLIGIFSKKSSSECDKLLESQEKNYKKHLIQEVVIQKKSKELLARGYYLFNSRERENTI